MDAEQFDAIAKRRVNGGASRRTMVRRLAVGTAAGAFVALGLREDASTAKKAKQRRIKVGRAKVEVCLRGRVVDLPLVAVGALFDRIDPSCDGACSPKDQHCVDGACIDEGGVGNCPAEPVLCYRDRFQYATCGGASQIGVGQCWHCDIHRDMAAPPTRMSRGPVSQLAPGPISGGNRSGGEGMVPLQSPSPCRPA